MSYAVELSNLTQTLKEVTTWGSWIRIAAPLIPAGVTAYSLILSLTANNAYFPTWFWILPLIYTLFDASSIPLNAFYLWSFSQDRQTMVND